MKTNKIINTLNVHICMKIHFIFHTTVMVNMYFATQRQKVVLVSRYGLLALQSIKVQYHYVFFYCSFT